MTGHGDRQLLGVLFLCTGNSARSILAEAIANKVGAVKLRAFSAGSQPTGVIHPLAVQLLEELNYSTNDLRSKHWSEFAKPNAKQLGLVITVCNNTVAEACPLWPGNPLLSHWSIPDPAQPNSHRADFKLVYDLLATKINALANLPIPSISTAELSRKLEQIAKTGNLPGDN